MAKHIGNDIYTRIYIYVLNKIILGKKVKRNLIKFLHSICHEMVWLEKSQRVRRVGKVVEWKVKFVSNRFAGGFVVHLLFVCPGFCVWMLQSLLMQLNFNESFPFFLTIHILQRKLNYTGKHTHTRSYSLRFSIFYWTGDPTGEGL